MPYTVDSGVVSYDFASETTPTAAPAPTPTPSFWDEFGSNVEEVTPNAEEDPLEYFFFALVEDGD